MNKEARFFLKRTTQSLVRKLSLGVDRTEQRKFSTIGCHSKPWTIVNKIAELTGPTRQGQSSLFMAPMGDSSQQHQGLDPIQVPSLVRRDAMRHSLGELLEDDITGSHF